MKHPILLLLVIILILSCSKKYDQEREELLGEWSTTEMFVNGDETYREYEVLYFSGDSLVIETTLTEVELFFDIESIADDKIITLTEHFKKQ